MIFTHVAYSTVTAGIALSFFWTVFFFFFYVNKTIVTQHAYYVFVALFDIFKRYYIENVCSSSSSFMYIAGFAGGLTRNMWHVTTCDGAEMCALR